MCVEDFVEFNQDNSKYIMSCDKIYNSKFKQIKDFDDFFTVELAREIDNNFKI